MTKEQIEPIYRADFPSFNGLTVTSFRNGSIITVADLSFGSTNPPSNSEIVVTLRNNLSTDQLNIIADSISTKFQDLAASVVLVFDMIYSERFGTLFIRTIVLAFRPVAQTRIEQDTEAEVELVFNQTSTDPVPTGDVITTTLREAVNNPNSTFNLTIDAETISIIRTPSTGTTNTTTQQSPNTTTQQMPNTVTQQTNTAPNSIVELEFTSSDTFVPDLLNPNSQAFISRAQITRQQIEPVFRRAFPSFIDLTVNSFRNGSIITNANLAFNPSVPLPSGNEIGIILRNAVLNSQVQLNIDPNSIKVNGTEISVNSDGVSTKTSLFTTSCLALTSLLLTHFR
ncbi:hypothetical protein AAFF_G00357750 [Aldrovandia affinis]|uniref:SEA domain-containing protein n=1 Tax=Aldrovandia affinis TaxID=143900 RepID=A0AAD7X0Y8_9TELE|nr:hypothetical protein AAFF_G00357750 [Aldrovandia affinis]